MFISISQYVFIYEHVACTCLIVYFHVEGFYGVAVLQMKGGTSVIDTLYTVNYTSPTRFLYDTFSVFISIRMWITFYVHMHACTCVYVYFYVEGFHVAVLQMTKLPSSDDEEPKLTLNFKLIIITVNIKL